MIFLLVLILIAAALFCGVKFHDQIVACVNRFMKKTETLVPLVNGRVIGARKTFADFLKENGTSGDFAEDIRRWENYGGPSKADYERYVKGILG